MKHLFYRHGEIETSNRRYTIVYSAIGWAIVGGSAWYMSSQANTEEKKKKNAIEDLAGRDAAIKSAMQPAPIGTEATSAEKARIRKKTKTILTSPLKGDEFGSGPTLLGSGDTTKKMVLG